MKTDLLVEILEDDRKNDWIGPVEDKLVDELIERVRVSNSQAQAQVYADMSGQTDADDDHLFFEDLAKLKQLIKAKPHVMQIILQRLAHAISSMTEVSGGKDLWTRLFSQAKKVEGKSLKPSKSRKLSEDEKLMIASVADLFSSTAASNPDLFGTLLKFVGVPARL